MCYLDLNISEPVKLVKFNFISTEIEAMTRYCIVQVSFSEWLVYDKLLEHLISLNRFVLGNHVTRTLGKKRKNKRRYICQYNEASFGRSLQLYPLHLPVLCSHYLFATKIFERLIIPNPRFVLIKKLLWNRASQTYLYCDKSQTLVLVNKPCDLGCIV